MKVYLAILGIIFLGLAGCTANQRAQAFGGEETIQLAEGQKVLIATWKEGNTLWILTRQRRADEKPETVTFEEKSSFGILQGRVILIEK